MESGDPRAALTALAPVAPAAGAATLQGTVTAADVPVAGARVGLYVAGASRARQVGTATTDPRGSFTLGYSARKGGAPLYVIARGGIAGRTCSGQACPGARRELMAVTGTASQPLTTVSITEQTTVASAYALARFLHGRAVTGPAPGLPSAAATAANLMEARTGKLSFVLANPPNGTATEALPTFNTLANALASCAAGTRASCEKLFAAAKAPGAALPATTLQAAHAVALHPWLHPSQIFRLAAANVVHTPALRRPPAAWTLALVYTAGGFDAPGRMAFDRHGNVWAGNNWRQPGTAGGNGVTVLSPTGQPIFGSPIVGGGVQAVGFGTAIDPRGRVWLGNYGGSSISVLGPTGKPLTRRPFTAGQISKPQGIIADQAGSLWIPNFGNDTVTVYRGGSPARAQILATTAGQVTQPFAVAIDGARRAWVTNNSLAASPGWVTVFRNDGDAATARTVTGGGLRSPMGVAIDSGGNAWVANFLSRSVTRIGPDLRLDSRSPIRAPSINGPWGIAVDGDDTVWVAGFLNHNVTQLCGRRTSACPPGAKAGDPISPPSTGYASAAFQHITAVQVDPSGNVWAANNWSTGSPLSKFLGGNGLVELVGAAAPVRTPLIGLPQRP